MRKLNFKNHKHMNPELKKKKNPQTHQNPNQHQYILETTNQKSKA